MFLCKRKQTKRKNLIDFRINCDLVVVDSAGSLVRIAAGSVDIRKRQYENEQSKKLSSLYSSLLLSTKID